MPPDTPPESYHTWTPAPDGEPAPDSLDTWAPELHGPASLVAPKDDDDRYTDGGLLGRGGIAEVRSVHDARLGREVAVKRLRRVGSRVGRKRFHREARVTAQLEHPGIVPVYDAAIGPDGVPYYTMKFVRGTALSAALRQARGLEGRLELVPAFNAVCQAMAYAHDRRVIHRDLKPDNIMLGEFGEALVVDWGLARTLDDDDLTEELTDEVPPPGGSLEGSARPLDIDHTALTVVGQVSGTPAYMAPEQARGERTDPATDVYALGAILYELLTGSPPHGHTTDVQAQLARARTGVFEPVLDRVPEAPPTSPPSPSAPSPSVLPIATPPRPSWRWSWGAGAPGAWCRPTPTRRWSTSGASPSGTRFPWPSRASASLPPCWSAPSGSFASTPSAPVPCTARRWPSMPWRAPTATWRRCTPSGPTGTSARATHSPVEPTPSPP